jgi:hypothetical protein
MGVSSQWTWIFPVSKGIGYLVSWFGNFDVFAYLCGGLLQPTRRAGRMSRSIDSPRHPQRLKRGGKFFFPLNR